MYVQSKVITWAHLFETCMYQTSLWDAWHVNQYLAGIATLRRPVYLPR